MTSVEHRLAHLEGIDLSEEDLESIRAEFEEYDRAIARLEAFAGDTPWVSAPVPPPGATDDAAR